MKIRSPNLKPETIVENICWVCSLKVWSLWATLEHFGYWRRLPMPKASGITGHESPTTEVLGCSTQWKTESARRLCQETLGHKPHQPGVRLWQAESGLPFWRESNHAKTLVWETLGREQKWEKPLRIIRDQRIEPCAKHERQVLYEHVHTSLRLEKSQGKKTASDTGKVHPGSLHQQRWQSWEMHPRDKSKK